MIKEDLGLEFTDFLKQYVILPICEYTISFSFRGRCFQFNCLGTPKNKDGSTSYEFISYKSDWNSDYKIIKFKSLKEAVEKAVIDGVSFKEVYESPESELIDIS